MTIDKFAQQIKAVNQRVAVLYQYAYSQPVQQSKLLEEVFEELSITLEELRIAEEELHQQNEDLAVARAAVEVGRQRYQDLFEFAPDGYLVTDAVWIIQEANHAVATLLNVPQHYLVGKPLISYILYEERQAFRLKLNQLCQINRVQEWEVRLHPRNSAAFDAALTVATVRDGEGKPVSWRWLVRDITARKRTTAQLQQALEFEAMLKRITDKVRDCLDESQILQTAVQELALVLGLSGCNAAWYNLDEGTSTIRYEYVTNIPTSQGRVAQMADFPEFYRQLVQGQYFQFCSIVPSPVRGRVAMLACPIVDDRAVLGDLWLINQQEHAFNDLEIRLVQQVANQCAIAIRTARLYQAATAKVEELEKLNSLKDDFLSTVSHELRTPISNMKVAIRMLQTAPAAPARERYLHILQAECDREAELLNNLLDLQQLEAASYSISLDTVSLQDWLPSIIEPFQLRTQQRQHRFHVDLPSVLLPLLSDRANLGRILAELLNNAYKYTPSGGEIVLRVRQDSGPSAGIFDSMVVKRRDETPVTTFTVSNQAEIPSSELPRIFDKLYRVPKADPWKQGGTGLGLALVQKLVEQLQGTILVESCRGWTTFTVQLPKYQN